MKLVSLLEGTDPKSNAIEKLDAYIAHIRAGEDDGDDGTGYGWSDEDARAEQEALAALTAAGFDWEGDDDLRDYCLKATDLECAEETKRRFLQYCGLSESKRVTVKKCDGEYRLPGEDGREETAYYSDDKEDVIATAKRFYGDDVQLRFRTVKEDWT